MGREPQPEAKPDISLDSIKVPDLPKPSEAVREYSDLRGGTLQDPYLWLKTRHRGTQDVCVPHFRSDLLLVDRSIFTPDSRRVRLSWLRAIECGCPCRDWQHNRERAGHFLYRYALSVPQALNLMNAITGLAETCQKSSPVGLNLGPRGIPTLFPSPPPSPRCLSAPRCG